MADNNGVATPPDMTLDTPMQDQGEFLGMIIRDDWSQKEDGKWSWHLGFKPADFDVQGETHMLHDWYKLSDRKNSKMGALREAMMGMPDVFPIGQGVKIGQGHYNGIVCWWTRQDIEFGKDRNTGEVFKAEGVFIPVRAATAEEIERAKKRAGTVTGAPSDPQPEASSSELDADTLKAVLEIVDGKTQQEVQMALSREPGRFLPRDVKSAMLSGALQGQLAESGALVTSGGVYTLVQ